MFPGGSSGIEQLGNAF
jgi:DNA-binding LacI/PurR family transcriptional regulator